MLRYLATGICFKCVGACAPFRALYRFVGNTKNERPISIKFTRWIWEIAEASGADQLGKRILELGTGWTHANSLYIGLVGDAKISAFDVVDNRSLGSLKYQLPLILNDVEKNAAIAPESKARARQRAARVVGAQSFEDVYEILNLDYRCVASGVPAFAPESFDYIYSCDVLEHVRAEDFATLVQHWKRLLKPGGIFAAQVGLDDHISHRNKTRHKKEYLKFPDWVFRWLICSDLQYINRLTASAILDCFAGSGFTIVSAATERCDITGLKIHPHYMKQSPTDLSAVRLTFNASKREPDNEGT